MGGVRVYLTPEGGATFRGRITGIKDRLGEDTILSELIMEALEEYHDARWGQGVRDTQSTADRWPDTPGKLINTGTLKTSLTKHGGHAVRRPLPGGGFEFGTDLVYAMFLQHGTRKMSAKPVLRFTRAVRVLIAATARRFLFEL